MTDRKDLFVRLGKLADDDRSVDYAYWNSVGDEERYRAAWELVVQAYELQGKVMDELRFQRSVTKLVKRGG